MEGSQENSTIYRFADFTVDAKARVLSRNGEVISLTPRVFDTLLAFVRKPGETISKDELMSTIWEESFVEESNLTQNVAVLRKALGENSREHRYIVTVPGKGYRFVPEVAEISERGEIVMSDPESPGRDTGGTQVSQPRNRLVVGLIGGLLVLLIAGMAGYFYFQGRRGTAVTVARTRQITSFSGLELYPDFAPNGNSIAYSSNKTGTFEIYTRQLIPGANEVQITSDGGHSLQPAFSPDGTRLAYYSAQRGGIWIVPSSGGTPRRVTNFGSNPTWSPDSQSLAFQADHAN